MLNSFKGKNPFNQRRSTAQEEDIDEMLPNKKLTNVNMTAPSGNERKGTSGQLNRNESTSHLTQNVSQDNRQVELKAQSGEHSQLFMESQSHYPSTLVPGMSRFTN